MMVEPSLTDLLKKVDNRYELVVATAKRARQLSKGDEPLVNKEEESKVTLAADEIAAGKVVIRRDGMEENIDMAEDNDDYEEDEDYDNYEDHEDDEEYNDEDIENEDYEEVVEEEE